MIVFIFGLVSAILGVNMYNTIRNNDDYPAGGQTDQEMRDLKGHRNYFIFMIIVSLLAIVMAGFYLYFQYKPSFKFVRV